MTVLSCIGHWYQDMLFAVPFLGIAGFIGWDKRRHDAETTRMAAGDDLLPDRAAEEECQAGRRSRRSRFARTSGHSSAITPK